MYRERPIADDLRNIGCCSWLRVASDDAPARIVPDACTDIIWTGEQLVLAGPDTRPTLHTLQPGAFAVGVRFGPAQGSRLVSAPADALRDARAPLATWWGSQALRLQDTLHAQRDPHEALAILERAVAAAATHAAPPDKLVRATVQRIERNHDTSVAELARDFGVSERQLLRRCNAHLGYGPKFLARVFRFQRFLDTLRATPTAALSDLAFATGYTDQAHLGHEVAELAGTTPGSLKNEALLRMSDSDKTARLARPHSAAHADHRL